MAIKVKLGDLLVLLTDYHANGAYKKLKENVELLDAPDFAVMIRTTNFEQNNFESQLKFITEHAYNFLKKSKVYAGDIIMNKIANAGSSYLMPELGKQVSLAMNLFLLRIDPLKANPVYVFLYLKLNEAYVKSFANGSVTKTITKEAVRNLDIELPERYIQDEVVNTYFRFTDKIEVNKKTNQTLEQMAQVLFNSWFVDFVPVIDNALTAGNPIPDALQARAELRQRVIAERATNPKLKPLPDNIQQLFPSEFEESELGWMPKGWRVSNTDSEFGIKGGSTPSTKNPEFWEGGDIHWTSPKDLSGNQSKILPDTNRKITKAGLAKITSGLLPVDTVLMSSRAPVGYLALAKVPLAINQGYIALECKKDLTPEYTLQFLDSIMDEIKGISGGTTFAEISKKTFRSIMLVIPSKPVIDVFTSIAKVNYDKITKNIKQTNSLTETRDYLLPKLISGELEVNN
jgi:type I restriction enzyme S subunit